LKGLAGRRRRCAGGGIRPSSSIPEHSADPNAV
jgi:hypothetical protein